MWLPTKFVVGPHCGRSYPGKTLRYFPSGRSLRASYPWEKVCQHTRYFQCLQIKDLQCSCHPQEPVQTRPYVSVTPSVWFLCPYMLVRVLLLISSALVHLLLAQQDIVELIATCFDLDNLHHAIVSVTEQQVRPCAAAEWTVDAVGFMSALHVVAE